MSANPYNFQDGEMIECEGGPEHGKFSHVSVVFPFLNGGCPSSLMQSGNHWYRLDQERRKWVYAGVDGADVKSGVNNF